MGLLKPENNVMTEIWLMEIGVTPLARQNLNTDGDGIHDILITGPSISNANQLDADHDEIGMFVISQTCGNHNLEGSESCDDGNLMPGDGLFGYLYSWVVRYR